MTLDSLNTQFSQLSLGPQGQVAEKSAEKAEVASEQIGSLVSGMGDIVSVVHAMSETVSVAHEVALSRFYVMAERVCKLLSARAKGQYIGETVSTKAWNKMCLFAEYIMNNPPEKPMRYPAKEYGLELTCEYTGKSVIALGNKNRKLHVQRSDKKKIFYTFDLITGKIGVRSVISLKDQKKILHANQEEAVIKHVKIDSQEQDGIIEIDRIFRRKSKKGVEKFVMDTPFYVKGDLFDFVTSDDYGALFRQITQKERLLKLTTMVRTLAEALAFFHKNGVVYQDLKLENVFMDQSGKVRLADFDSCCFDHQKDYKAFYYTGTLAYAPPELFFPTEWNFPNGYVSSPSRDVWSLGVLSYVLLTNDTEAVSRRFDQIKSDFQDKKGSYFDERIDFAKRTRRVIDGPWANLLTAMLQKDPTRRPTTELLIERLKEVEKYYA